MIGGIFVDTQQASGRSDTQPFGQRRRAAQEVVRSVRIPASAVPVVADMMPPHLA
jgi:hypothetical protein